MAAPELDNLVAIGMLHRTAATRAELEHLIRTGSARVGDARNSVLAIESRFDLAYNGAHALALAALRHHGYRSENRYVVFQSLPHTLQLPQPVWRILAKAHGDRNRIEYEGEGVHDERFLEELVTAALTLEAAVRKMVG